MKHTEKLKAVRNVGRMLKAEAAEEVPYPTARRLPITILARRAIYKSMY
jgi:hypothetical protein